MMFTQEQINEIEHRLAKKGAKDTQLPSAKTPLTGDESVAVVQEGENRLVPVGSILNTDAGIFNVSEYLKAKTEADTSVILTLSEAVEACPSRAKKAGQIITFLDKTKVWQQYQYQSNNITDWNNLLKWKNLNDINTKPIDDETAVIYNISDYIPGGSKYGQVIYPGIYTIYGTTTPVSQYRVIGGYDDSLGEVSFPLQLDETIVIKEIDDSVAVYDTYYLFAGNSIDGYGYQTTLYSDDDVIPDYILRAFGDDSAYVLVNINRLENKINGKLDKKVDKVTGKGLSTNDFTDANVTELANSIVNAIYNSNTKKLVFTKNNSGTIEIDATPFIKDGMIDEVKIENGYLVIVFNTDSGKETIRIALVDIFNPDNYYTRAQTDNLLGNKVDKEQGKGLSTNDYTTAEKTKLGDLPTATELTQTLGSKANTNDLATVATSGSYNDLSNKPDLSNFITNSVDDLVNYYLKSETYTKTEVQQLIGAIQQFHYEVYPTLPQTGASNVLYLIGPTGTGADKYEEYVYANNTWTKIGDTSIDLSGYVTTQALTTALADYVTSSALSTALAGKADKSEMSVVQGTGANADKTTITLKQGTSATVLTEHQNISGKENVMPITTATGATLSAVVGNYYRLDNVGTLAITLPTIIGATKLQAITFLLACGSSALVTFAPQGSETILYQEDFALEADTTYEVTALWNGSEWTLSRVIYE